MVRRLPYDGWLAASNELKAIRSRARMTGARLPEDIFTGAVCALDVERIPMMAALQLRNMSALIRYPSLRRSVAKLAENLLPYTAADWGEPAVVQFPDFALKGMNQNPIQQP